LIPLEIGGGTSVVGLRANLDSRDYAYTLTPLDKHQATITEDKHLLFGSVKTHKLVQTLATYGIRDARISNDNGEETIELGSLGARIIVGCERTLIETGGNESLRLMLRDAVVSLLTEL